jgi:hypothetical protein
MNHRNPKRPRIKLPLEVYKELQLEVLDATNEDARIAALRKTYRYTIRNSEADVAMTVSKTLSRCVLSAIRQRTAA